MLYLILLLVFLNVFILFSFLLNCIFRSKYTIQTRLEGITKQHSSDADDELNQPVFVRIIQPLMDDISKTILKITPREMVTAFEKKVVTAGKPLNLSIRDWVNIQVALVGGIPAVTLVLGYFRNIPFEKVLLLVLAELGFGLIVPGFFLSRKATQRQTRITNSMPDVLDMLTVSVEAGLGFDAALAKVIDKTPGPLADEFEIVLQEIKVGKQKKDALRDMTERVGVQDLTSFVGSIIQAEHLGVSIGNVLRIQSEQMRQKRKQRAQEKAMKAPVKMLIPMALFIFPTIFAILMGPVVIRTMKMFMK